MATIGSESARCFWPSTNASIPSGWVEDTDFAGLYLQGASETFVSSSPGGSSSHTHTANGHTHTATGSHTHTVSAGTSGSLSTAGLNAGTPPATPPVAATHTHGSSTSAAATITYETVVVSIGSDSTQPSSVTLIVIKPTSPYRHIPDGAVALTDEASAPTGFGITDGAGGRPDIDGVFVKGAAAGADANLTPSGSATHSHTQSHSHTQGHTHGAAASANGSPTLTYRGSGTSVRTYAHHNVSLTNANTTTGSDATATNTASTEPAYNTLLGIVASGPSTPIGVVLPFVCPPDKLPEGWALCNGIDSIEDCRDVQIKVTKTPGSVGTTGGSNTHTHTFSAHGHTISAHTHGSSVSDFGSVSVGSGSTTALSGLFGISHTHTWTIGSATPGINNATITLSGTVDGRLPYRTVIFAKKIAEPVEGPGGAAGEDYPPFFIAPAQSWWPGDDLDPYPGHPRTWAEGACANAVYGKHVVTPADVAVSSFLTAADVNRSILCTVNPVRAQAAIVEAPSLANQERCRHHFARRFVRRDGRTRVVHCYSPNTGREYEDKGGSFVGRETGGTDENGDFYVPVNRTAFVAPMALPDTFLLYLVGESNDCSAVT